MRVYAPLTAVMILSACNLPMGGFRINPTDSPTAFSVPTVISGNCGADPLQGLLGQPESALANVSLPANTRIIRPGTDFTKDANRGRLNVGISASGTIVHVACG